MLHKAQSLSSQSSRSVMLKLSVLVCCILAICLGRPEEDKYPEVDSNFNVSELLGNERLLLNYIKCLLDEGPCTAQVKQIREHVQEILETKCAKCTDRQKEVGKQLVPAIKEKHPDLWDKLVAKYDPDGKYQKGFSEILDN